MALALVSLFSFSASASAQLWGGGRCVACGPLNTSNHIGYHHEFWENKPYLEGSVMPFQDTNIFGTLKTGLEKESFGFYNQGFTLFCENQASISEWQNHEAWFMSSIRVEATLILRFNADDGPMTALTKTTYDRTQLCFPDMNLFNYRNSGIYVGQQWWPEPWNWKMANGDTSGRVMIPFISSNDFPSEKNTTWSFNIHTWNDATPLGVRGKWRIEKYDVKFITTYTAYNHHLFNSYGPWASEWEFRWVPLPLVTSYPWVQTRTAEKVVTFSNFHPDDYAWVPMPVWGTKPYGVQFLMPPFPNFMEILLPPGGDPIGGGGGGQ